MKRYEYTSKGFHVINYTGTFERLDTELNAMAKHGWRLVSTFRGEQANVVKCVFERELQLEEE